MNENNTRVWLVGAGPGDPGLLTLRAREVIENAEAVVYDRLVGAGVLALMPEDAIKIDVGKNSGTHPVPQREIENILIEYARKGLRVVRLKGGDPFVFGRGGEEAEALVKADINFEIVPGVTSGIAAPAYAGIPVTHRNLASSLHFITAHAKTGELPDINFDALAKLKHSTLLFYMGVETAGLVCEQLIKSGMSKDTPAAVIERGTTSKQREFISSLNNLPSEIAAHNIKSPAMILVGEVAGLSENLNWRSNLKLSGVKIAVTRPKKRAGKLSRMLRDLGAEVLELPCIETEILHDAKLPDFNNYNWLAFTSVTGVEALFALLAESSRDIRELGNIKIAAIGKATADALRERGLRVDYMPEVYDGVNLAQGLANIMTQDEKLLMLRAKSGSRELNEILELNNINYEELAVYETKYLKCSVPDDLDMAVFTSASTVKAFIESCGDGFKLDNIKAICIGLQTAREALFADFTKIYTAARADLNALVQAACEAR
ncbi:MAG: uroporphyrinogen-III C-methyltransferase [Synergistaceae bacterium]|nr:uroporphyrinogen-III C-methyltransferase [Synergistaceae bacterium]